MSTDPRSASEGARNRTLSALSVALLLDVDKAARTPRGTVHQKRERLRVFWWRQPQQRPRNPAKKQQREDGRDRRSSSNGQDVTGAVARKVARKVARNVTSDVNKRRYKRRCMPAKKQQRQDGGGERPPEQAEGGRYIHERGLPLSDNVGQRPHDHEGLRTRVAALRLKPLRAGWRLGLRPWRSSHFLAE